MPQITVPKDFFVKERRMYSDWKFAFWREFFQNSIDAGATRIDISTEQIDNGIRVHFCDNGCGMSRDTLENVYFRLGASSKNDDSTVGGFGRARILTCFSMDKYSIHTQDNLVNGDGGTYDISCAEHRDGTLITVEMTDENYYSLLDELRLYLRTSQMRCNVFVNNIKFTEWSLRRQVRRCLSVDGVDFATVHVSENADFKQLMLIRVLGTIMYMQYINTNVQIIVEIDPAQSRKVLTANRDGMHGAYAREINKFCQELASESISALRPKFERKNAIINGRGLIVSYAKRSQQAEVVSNNPLQPTATEHVVQNARESISVAEMIGRPSVVKIASESAIAEATPTATGPTTDLPDVWIVDESDNPKVRKVIDNFNPLNWQEVYNYRDGRTIRKGNTIFKLLMLWKTACAHAIEALQMSSKQPRDYAWGLGWVFSSNTQAMCRGVSGGHALLLNPVDEEGNLKFFISSQKSQKQLMAYAKHEVAHMVCNLHNEEFALIMTTIDQHFDEREVYRLMREQIAAIKAKQGE